MCRPAARELITQGSETRPRPVSNAGRHCYFVGIRVEATAPLTSAIERTPFRRAAAWADAGQGRVRARLQRVLPWQGCRSEGEP